MPSTTENQMLKSIFDSCSVDGINNLRNGAIEGIKNIVAEESEGDLYQYFLPKKIWSELDKSISHVSDLMSGKEQAQATKRREKSVSIAIADATQHILKFLYPGQILILSMLDEIRIENKWLKNQVKNLESELATKNDIGELMSELRGVRAELAETRTVAYQLKENATKVQANPAVGYR